MKAKALVKKIGGILYKNRSNIEFVAGMGMVVTGTGMIMAKAEEATEVKRNMQGYIQAINEADEMDSWDSENTRAHACIDMAKQTAVGYVKCYGPGLAVETAGLVLIGVSKATDRKEIAVTSAALASTTMEFMNYRKRVQEELGDEKDEEFLLGKPDTIIETDIQTGEEKVIANKSKYRPDHSIMFDEQNPNWDKRGFSNLEFLEDHERWLNQRLELEGYITENEIRKDIDADPDPKAEGYGITLLDENGNRNYISFGIQKNTERAQA